MQYFFSKTLFLFLLAALFFYSTPTNTGLKDQRLGFDKVIIWGHKLHSHTHSYIHEGFYRAFKHMGYDTYWFDDKDDIRYFNFDNALFITEHQVDKRIPLLNNCFYIIHSIAEGNRAINEHKYRSLLEAKRCISLNVYRTDLVPANAQKITDYHYCTPDEKAIYMPWATDLLPHEIDAIKKQLPFKNKRNIVYYIGTVDDGTRPEVNPFIQACEQNGVSFVHLGGYGDGRVAMEKVKINTEKNIEHIQASCMAPALCRAFQCKTSYIPCRIFKNISYGQFGVTNSKAVYELFGKKIIYNPDTYQLFFDAQKQLPQVTLKQQYELMDFVRDKHTYVNRINTLLDFFHLVRTQETQETDKAYQPK
jgi:hypothetical protein